MTWRTWWEQADGTWTYVQTDTEHEAWSIRGTLLDAGVENVRVRETGGYGYNRDIRTGQALT